MAYHIVFGGPPGPTAAGFVEIEDGDGHGVAAGEWSRRSDGFWVLTLPAPGDAPEVPWIDCEDCGGKGRDGDDYDCETCHGCGSVRDRGAP